MRLQRWFVATLLAGLCAAVAAADAPLKYPRRATAT